MSLSARSIETLFRQESRPILGTLLRVVKNFELAEESLQDAFEAALLQWPADGIPQNPRAWILQAARNKATDRIRRDIRFRDKERDLLFLEGEAKAESGLDDAFTQCHVLEDDRLRLIFTCCHPAIQEDARVALTLRTLCGLTSEEIARVFFSEVPTIQQRIVRAKNKIREAGIPFVIPEKADLPERMAGVLTVLYLVFTEGYAATSGEELVRRELCEEAIRLCRLVHAHFPDRIDVTGLLALMLLHHARRESRVSDTGTLRLLDEQDRSTWDSAMIEEGAALVERALRGGPPHPYSVQAAIAALHARAPSSEATDWAQIVALYGVLLELQPSPVVALNRAAAIAMAEGAARGLLAIEAAEKDPSLAGYHLVSAAKADMLRRLGRPVEAAEQYRLALSCVRTTAEKKFLEGRLAEVENQARPT